MTFFGNTYRTLRLLPWLIGAVSALLYAAAMPGIDFPEAAWLWAIPFALWAATQPSWKSWLLTGFFALWLAKIITLIWLRHVYPPLGWLGLVFLTAATAALPALWLALLRWLFPRMSGAPLTARLIIQLGLAGAWVLLEWVQSWLLTGFPWMLLADTQWLRPVALSLCALGGPWALSFVIILFNLGLARYFRRMIWERETRPDSAPGPLAVLRNICPEFYLGAVPIFFAFFSFWNAFKFLNAHTTTLFTAGVIQTDFDPNAKWDDNRVAENIETVRQLTIAAAQLTPNNPVYDARTGDFKGDDTAGGTPHVILWPEAALPFHIGHAGFNQFLVDLAAATKTTLLIGAISRGADNGYFNGIYTVTATGVGEAFYAKRHLVPFGEYVPFANILPLRKVVPVSEDSLVGTRHTPLPVPVDDTVLQAGTLVCYEDVFPDLSLDMARRGADFMVVVTNDAWYGHEAGAYQHAAHSAVMAASLRLPVVRCGNNGWSGVFNPLGQQQALKDDTGSIYFRGAGRFEVQGVPSLLREPTFYMKNGNWVVSFSGLFFLWAYLRNRRWRRKDTTENL